MVMMGRRAAKIAKVKGREDAKRGKAFARIGKKIIMVSTRARHQIMIWGLFLVQKLPGGWVVLVVAASSRSEMKAFVKIL